MVANGGLSPLLGALYEQNKTPPEHFAKYGPLRVERVKSQALSRGSGAGSHLEIPRTQAPAGRDFRSACRKRVVPRAGSGLSKLARIAGENGGGRAIRTRLLAALGGPQGTYSPRQTLRAFP